MYTQTYIDCSKWQEHCRLLHWQCSCFQTANVFANISMMRIRLNCSLALRWKVAEIEHQKSEKTSNNFVTYFIVWLLKNDVETVAIVAGGFRMMTQTATPRSLNVLPGFLRAPKRLKYVVSRNLAWVPNRYEFCHREIWMSFLLTFAKKTRKKCVSEKYLIHTTTWPAAEPSLFTRLRNHPTFLPQTNVKLELLPLPYPF